MAERVCLCVCSCSCSGEGRCSGQCCRCRFTDSCAMAGMQRATCNEQMQHTACNMRQMACDIQCAACNTGMPHVPSHARSSAIALARRQLQPKAASSSLVTRTDARVCLPCSARRSFSCQRHRCNPPPVSVRVFVCAPVCLFACVMRSMPTTSTHTATCLCTRASPRRTGNLRDHFRLMPQCPLIATTYATHAWQDDPIASAPTSAPGLRPHPRRDCAHIRAGTVPTSAPGLRPHPRRDCAHIRAGTVPTSPPGLRPDLRGSSTLHPPGRELRVPTGAQLSD
jgi:hypothetical protein